MTSTPQPTRVSSRIAAHQLLHQQQEQQQKLQQPRDYGSRSSSAAHSRAGSPSARAGSQTDSWDASADDSLINDHDHHQNANGSHQPGSDMDSEGPTTADQGDKTMEIDQAAFEDRDVLSTWEFAFVYGFLLKFKPLLRQNYPLHNISEQDLETALFATSNNNTIEQIHCNLLSNMQNRKKAVEPTSWQRALSDVLDSKARTGELEFDNPLRFYRSYYQIPPADRIQILKSLIDWVLQESLIVRQGIEEAKDLYLVQPFGTDQTKGVYWYFGEGSTKLYRESNPNRKNAKWETVATSLEDIKQLTDSFGKSTSNAEKALRDRLQAEIIEPIEEKQFQEVKRAERAEKKMLRLAKFHEMAAMRTTRTRSSNRTNVVKYNYDEDDDEFEDEEASYVSYTPQSRGQESLTEEAAMDSETPSAPSVQVGNNDAEEEEEDRKSDASISIALERTRVGDITETDRSPKRMKMEEENISAPMTASLPAASSGIAQEASLEQPSVLAFQPPLDPNTMASLSSWPTQPSSDTFPK